MRVLVLVEIRGAHGAPASVRFNAVKVRGGANFAPADTLGHTNGGHQGTTLRANFATKPQAKPAIHAGAAARAGLRQYRHRRRQRVPSPFPRPALTKHAGSFHA